MAKYKTIIGRAELMNIPELLLSDIPVKSDTGAYSSSIHATDIIEKSKNGKKSLSFTLLGNHPVYRYSREIVVHEYTKKTIENSFGQRQERYAVKLRVKLGGKIFNSEFTLADRSKKPFPVLLGRTFMNKRFIVDPSLANINRRDLKETLLLWSNNNNDTDEDLLS